MGISVSDLKIVCVAGVVVVVVIGIVTKEGVAVDIHVQISYCQVDDAPTWLGDGVDAVCIVGIVFRVQR